MLKFIRTLWIKITTYPQIRITFVRFKTLIYSIWQRKTAWPPLPIVEYCVEQYGTCLLESLLSHHLQPVQCLSTHRHYLSFSLQTLGLRSVALFNRDGIHVPAPSEINQAATTWCCGELKGGGESVVKFV